MGNGRLSYKLAAVLFMVSILLGACGGNKTATARPSGSDVKEGSTADAVRKDKLKFRITWTTYSGRGEAIQKIVDTYNRKNADNLEIEEISGDEDITAIEKLLTGDGMDIVYVLPYRYVKYYGDKGLLVDLSGDFTKEKSFFYPELWKLAGVGGATFGIPWLGHSMCLLYNKDILVKAGVNGSSIKSLDDLVHACEAVESQTGAKGMGLVGANHNDVSWMVNQFIYGYGSSLVNKDGSKVTVNNARSMEAISFYKDVLGRHAQASWTDDTGVEVMNRFRDQEVAFEIQGIWGATDIEKNGKPFEVGIKALEDIGLYSEVGPMMLAIPKSMDTARKKKALGFMRFLITKDAQTAIMAGEYSPEHDAYYPFRTPVRKDLADSLIFEKYPEYIPFLVGFRRPSIDVPVPKWQTVKDKYYAPGLHRVMKGEMTIDAFLKMVETEGNKILSK